MRMIQGILITALFTVLSLSPANVFGAELYSTNATGSSTPLGLDTDVTTGVYQSLGTGLTGRMTSFDVGLFFRDTATTSHYYPQIVFLEGEAPNPGVDPGVVIRTLTAVESLIATGTVGAYRHTVSADTNPSLASQLDPGFQLDPDLYYGVLIYNQSDIVYENQNSGLHPVGAYAHSGFITSIVGTTTSSFSGGSCVDLTGIGYSPNLCATFADIDIVLYGVQTSANNGIYNFTSPTAGQVTFEQQNVVPVSFNYGALVVPYVTPYDIVGIRLVTASGLVLSDTLEYEETANGVLYQRDLVLADGQYWIIPYLRDSTGQKPIFYGERRSFATSPDNFVINYNNIAQPDPLFFSSTTYIGTNGTTTQFIYNPDSLLGTIGFEQIWDKFPFSYVKDAYNIFALISSTKSSSTAEVVFPLGAQYTNHQTGSSSDSFTIIDLQTTGQIPAVQTMKSTVTAVLYVMTALMIISTAMNAL